MSSNIKGRGLKIGNEYAREFSAYRDIPKAVFAAVAFSFGMRLNGDDMHNAIGAFYQEWRTLHENGIVSQAPPKLGGPHV